MIKVIDFREHYLMVDAWERRSWTPRKKDATELLDYQSARRHARAVGALVVDLNTDQLEFRLD